jgi:hypothetical protein
MVNSCRLTTYWWSPLHRTFVGIYLTFEFKSIINHSCHLTTNSLVAVMRTQCNCTIKSCIIGWLDPFVVCRTMNIDWQRCNLIYRMGASIWNFLVQLSKVQNNRIIFRTVDMCREVFSEAPWKVKTETNYLKLQYIKWWLWVHCFDILNLFLIIVLNMFPAFRRLHW